ncbi:MAG: hypothetical protein R2751_11505 [Bacteroidales bacterium]
MSVPNASRPVQWVLFVVFAALMILPWFWNATTKHGPPPRPALDTVVPDRFGFYLEEVSESSGVVFQHESPCWTGNSIPSCHRSPPWAPVCPSGDVNRCYADIYATNSRSGTRNALYMNRGDGSFEDRASGMGVADLNRTGSG